MLACAAFAAMCASAMDAMGHATQALKILDTKLTEHHVCACSAFRRFGAEPGTPQPASTDIQCSNISLKPLNNRPTLYRAPPVRGAELRGPARARHGRGGHHPAPAGILCRCRSRRSAGPILGRDAPGRSCGVQAYSPLPRTLNPPTERAAALFAPVIRSLGSSMT